MKNFKRLVAGTIAAAMALALSVSAFAAEATITATSTDTTYFNEYAGGALKLKEGALTQEGQLTIVVIDKAKENDTLTGDDLYYINQGTKGETFWTTGMGTKVDLTTLVNEETTSKEFIVRIGGTNVTEGVIQIPMTVTYNAGTPDTPKVSFIWGDVDGNESIGVLDAAAVITGFLGGTTEGLPYEVGNTIPNTTVMWGDIDGNESIGVLDAAAIITGFLGGTTEGLPYDVGTTVEF